uniref:Uncharacterized protein n=1 Tax=Siphoviridae sp. ctzyE57 TaxID=2827982 RepID=A0A8S5SGM0_9CAUD|nr:MAG TPA: hypothetical protein [Siphoviridae sp. ctzyE57]
MALLWYVSLPMKSKFQKHSFFRTFFRRGYHDVQAI